MALQERLDEVGLLWRGDGLGAHRLSVSGTVMGRLCPSGSCKERLASMMVRQEPLDAVGLLPGLLSLDPVGSGTGRARTGSRGDGLGAHRLSVSGTVMGRLSRLASIRHFLKPDVLTLSSEDMYTSEWGGVAGPAPPSVPCLAYWLASWLTVKEGGGKSSLLRLCEHRLVTSAPTCYHFA